MDRSRTLGKYWRAAFFGGGSFSTSPFANSCFVLIGLVSVRFVLSVEFFIHFSCFLQYGRDTPNRVVCGVSAFCIRLTVSAPGLRTGWRLAQRDHSRELKIMKSDEYKLSKSGAHACLVMGRPREVPGGPFNTYLVPSRTLEARQGWFLCLQRIQVQVLHCVLISIN